MEKAVAVHQIKLSADQEVAGAQCPFRYLLHIGEGIGMNKSLGVAEAQPQCYFGQQVAEGNNIADYFKIAADQGYARTQFLFIRLLSEANVFRWTNH
jgi:hypothetical protein